jgi:hypothetical protein
VGHRPRGPFDLPLVHFPDRPSAVAGDSAAELPPIGFPVSLGPLGGPSQGLVANPLPLAAQLGGYPVMSMISSYSGFSRAYIRR